MRKSRWSINYSSKIIVAQGTPSGTHRPIAKKLKHKVADVYPPIKHNIHKVAKRSSKLKSRVKNSRNRSIIIYQVLSIKIQHKHDIPKVLLGKGMLVEPPNNGMNKTPSTGQTRLSKATNVCAH